MASSADVVRNMKIKTSTLNRLHKEYKYYQQEAEKEHARVESMKAAGADAHDLKQAVCSVCTLCKLAYNLVLQPVWHAATQPACNMAGQLSML
jgi:hypothetical protein